MPVDLDLALRAIRSVRCAARAADHLGDLRVVSLAPDGATGAFRAAVGRELEIPPDLPVREFARRAGLELRRPTVFLIDVPPVGAPDWWGEASALREDLIRCADGEPPPFAVLLLSAPNRPVIGDGFDLTVGQPSDGFLTNTATADSDLWRKYIHHRLAWEAAGDPVAAARIDECGFVVVPFGDDNGVERLLNDVAGQRFSALTGEEVALTRDYLEYACGRDRDREWQVRTITRLAASGLLWKPPGSSDIRPTPWLARAVLRRAEAGPACALLRGCLCCPSVAHAVLMRCFEIEARERVVPCLPDRPVLRSEDERRKWERASGLLEEFCRGKGEAADFYPDGCPAAPASAWDFTSFGEFFRFLPRDETRGPHRSAVQRVRNALSHGHYVSWEMVRVLLSAQERLG